MTQRFPYEQCRWHAGQPHIQKIWYEELEKIGPENVRARLSQTDAGSGGDHSIGAAFMTIGFAQEWLAWHDARKAKATADHLSRQIFWTRFAALSAFAAAAAGAIGWAWTILLKG